MEASALHAPAAGGLTRLTLGPLLRLRSDDQLVALFRAGSDDAFSVLVDRYQQRLFAYTRQMLGGARQDAEDVLQDVFVRAYSALRADDRELNVRAWLYRVAHNRCIDQLRRPTPAPSEVFEMSRKPLHDPIEEAQRRDDLRRLVADIGRLPEQQRSALLMREIDGMAYADLAAALDTTVPAVKSLLVRARVGLAEAVESRELDCSLIRVDLTEAYDRGVKASGRARRHMRECDGCREYRTALRGVRRSFAALSPLGLGPLAVTAKLIGLGGAGGGAAAGAGAGAGGGVAVSTMGVGAVSACKVAAVVCTAAIATGGAVEVRHLAGKPAERPGRSAHSAAAAAPAAAIPPKQVRAVAATPPVHTGTIKRTMADRVLPAPAKPRRSRPADGAVTAPLAPAEGAPAPAAGLPGALESTPPADGLAGTDGTGTGGAAAPSSPTTPSPATTSPPLPSTSPPPVAPTTKPQGATAPPAPTQGSQTAPPAGATGGTDAPVGEPPPAPPAEH